MPGLPRIAVIGCGGTIASVAPSSLDVLDYPEFGSKLPIEDVLQRFPETRLVADPFRGMARTPNPPSPALESGSRNPGICNRAWYGIARGDCLFSQPDIEPRS